MKRHSHDNKISRHLTWLCSVWYSVVKNAVTSLFRKYTALACSRKNIEALLSVVKSADTSVENTPALVRSPTLICGGVGYSYFTSNDEVAGSNPVAAQAV